MRENKTPKRETATQQIRVRPTLLRQIVSEAGQTMHKPPTPDSALAWLFGEYKRLKETSND